MTCSNGCRYENIRGVLVPKLDGTIVQRINLDGLVNTLDEFYQEQGNSVDHQRSVIIMPESGDIKYTTICSFVNPSKSFMPFDSREGRHIDEIALCGLKYEDTFLDNLPAEHLMKVGMALAIDIARGYEGHPIIVAPQKGCCGFKERTDYGYFDANYNLEMKPNNVTRLAMPYLRKGPKFELGSLDSPNKLAEIYKG